MPLHNDGERRRMLRFERIDVLIALGLAGLVNLAMLAGAAKLFHFNGLAGLTTIEAAPPRSAGLSAAARRSRLRSRCWHQALRRRASGPTRARS